MPDICFQLPPLKPPTHLHSSPSPPDYHIKPRKEKKRTALTSTLSNTTPRRELLPPLLSHLLQIQAVRLQPAHRGHILPLIPLHPLYEHLRAGFLFGGALLLLQRFGFLLRRVFLGALLGVDGEGGEVR